VTSTENGEYLAYERIAKSFGGVHALKNISFGIRSSEVHGLVGENGAGKSTLVKVTGGVHRPDAGQVLLDGRPVAFHSPRDSETRGIRIVHQEVPICHNLTVAENIFLDPSPPKKGMLLDRRQMNRRSIELLKRLGIDLDPTRNVGLCSAAERQLILIAKALSEDVRLVVLDEATSSLSDAEVQLLFDVIRNLKQRGTTFMFVSHRLSEVSLICDRITVLRNGEYIGTYNHPDVDFLTERIVGKEIEHVVRKDAKPSHDREVVLEVKGLTQEESGLSDISFKLHKGEVLGLAGLRGAGRTELVETLFGLRRLDRGSLLLRAEPINVRAPRDAIRHGFGFLSESRNEALYYTHSVRSNIASVVIDRLRRYGLIHGRRFSQVARTYVEDLQITTPSIHTEVGSLSGGKSAEGSARALACRRTGDPASGRADARCRRGGEERDSEADSRTRRSGCLHHVRLARLRGTRPGLRPRPHYQSGRADRRALERPSDRDEHRAADQRVGARACDRAPVGGYRDSRPGGWMIERMGTKK